MAARGIPLAKACVHPPALKLRTSSFLAVAAGMPACVAQIFSLFMKALILNGRRKGRPLRTGLPWSLARGDYAYHLQDAVPSWFLAWTGGGMDWLRSHQLLRYLTIRLTREGGNRGQSNRHGPPTGA